MEEVLTLEQSKKRERIYNILFYLGLLYILVFYILKGIGIINIPIWIELSPQFAGVFSAGVFF